jgi:AraC-like DNA-binding protein/mannose-6-phosphate isomerase-like protein (cupin superfamily)
LEPKKDIIFTESEGKNDIPIMIGESFGIDEGSCMLHYHECIEICYVRQGTGIYLIEGIEYEFKAGDIFVISSNEIHLAYNDRDVVMLVLLFMPNILYAGTGYPFEMEYIYTFHETRRQKLHKIDPADNFYNQILDSLMELLQENTDQSLGYELITKASLLKMTSNIKRCFNIQNQTVICNTAKKSELFQLVFSYIREKYSTKIKVEELAVLVNMSVSNFSLVFKKTTGFTPIEYVNKYRIAKASKLLLDTDKKIIDIAEETGFFSLPNFISCFKKYTGKLPKDYRTIRE